MAIRAHDQLNLNDLLHPDEQVRRVELSSAGQDRKHRLYICACGSEIDHLLTDPRSARAIQAAERFADGLLTLETLALAHHEAAEALKLLAIQEGAQALTPLTRDRGGALEAARQAARLAWLASTPEPLGPLTAELAAGQVHLALAWTGSAARLDLEELYQDLFGPPAVSLESGWLSWNDAVVRRIAERIYAERRFEELPILGDGLEEAGCTSADILDHCRGPGPHARGCFVVDLILGKV